MTKKEKTKLKKWLKEIINSNQITASQQKIINSHYQFLLGKIAQQTTCGNKVRARIVELHQFL